MLVEKTTNNYQAKPIEQTRTVETVQSVNPESRGAPAVTKGPKPIEGGDVLRRRKQPSDESIKQALEEINKKLNNHNMECVYGMHEKTNTVTIKVVNKETKEVVKEFPAEEKLDLISKAWELAGILVDKKL